MLKKLQFKPGINRENTRYTTEGGYYDCDKVRFRQGTPEKIGGWNKISNSTFNGICRSLWSWATLAGNVLTSVGTNTNYYISSLGAYYDMTPVRTTTTLTNPFSVASGSSIVTVHAPAHGAATGDSVYYSGATAFDGTVTGAIINSIFSITRTDADNYTITLPVTASSTATSVGGTTVAVYKLNGTPENPAGLSGWGTGAWGSDSWGNAVTHVTNTTRIWSQSNYGQDLVFGYNGGPMYYWEASQGFFPVQVVINIGSPAVITMLNSYFGGEVVYFRTTGALPTGLSAAIPYYVMNPSGSSFNISASPTGSPLVTTSGTQSGTTYVVPCSYRLDIKYGNDGYAPIIQNYVFVSDIYRFVFAFGCNDLGSTAQDPMLIRWSDQENASIWYPQITNQAGSLRLSHGSHIICALQTRQELLVFTDSTLYGMQYLGPPYVWNAQILGSNISIVSQNACVVAANIVYWMGRNKFYKYDGSVQTLRCDLRKYVFTDIDQGQYGQVFAGTNEGFNEVWWFYCSSGSTTVDKYVVYNYAEDIWYYGTMARTAWLNSGILTNPIAATYSGNIVTHEDGLDDNETSTTKAINAYITTSEFDLDDGNNYVFVKRILPDVTFLGSTATVPIATMSITPMVNSGSGNKFPSSVSSTNQATIAQTSTSVTLEEFTGQVFVRVRGRQFSFTIESTRKGVAWQLGSPRWDYVPDGRKGS